MHLSYILFSLFSFLIVQEKESLLDKKYGFQDIVLETDAKNYPGLEFKKEIKDPKIPEAAIYQAKGGHYTDIGGIKIHKLEVKTHKDLIYEIQIVVDKDPQLYKGLERRFGKGNYSMPNDAYVWNGTKVTLTYESHSKKKILLTYSSLPMRRVIWQSKEKDVDELADDF